MTMRADAARKRQHIVETAYRLFKRDGLHATGIDAIIAEAAVAKMTLYRHFPSKDELIVEVLGWRAARFGRQLDLLARADASWREKIVAVFDWHGNWFESADFHGCLFQHAIAEFGTPGHPVYEAATSQKQDFQKHLRAILAEAMPDDAARAQAESLSILIEGATILAQMGQGKTAIDTARKVALALMSGEARQ